MKKYFIIIALTFVSSPLFAQFFSSIGFETGMVYSVNSSSDGAPSPILPYFGVSGRAGISDSISLNPSVLLTGNYYLWSEEENKSIPAEIEYADSVWFLSIIMDVPVTFSYMIREKISVDLFMSPALVFKVPFKTWGTGEEDRGEMLRWFYSGRFVFFEAGTGVTWDYSDKRAFGLKTAIFYPLYHIWEGSDYLDRIMVKLGFTFSFKRNSSSS